MIWPKSSRPSCNLAPERHALKSRERILAMAAFWQAAEAVDDGWRAGLLVGLVGRQGIYRMLRNSRQEHGKVIE